MSTAMVLYQRWAVDDPVLDCAIMIVDMALYREALDAEDSDDYEDPYVPDSSHAT